MAVEYLDKGNDDGTNFGRSDGKIGFYGLAAPIAKLAFSNAALTTTLMTSAVPWGFASSTNAEAMKDLVNEIRAKLVALGLFTT
jgi:hypothetical protein